MLSTRSEEIECGEVVPLACFAAKSDWCVVERVLMIDDILRKM